MKTKFDIIYEDIMKTLKDAQVKYELVSEFKKKAEQKIENATQQNIKAIVKQIKKSLKYNDPSKQDKIEQLKKLCQKKFNKELIEKIF